MRWFIYAFCAALSLPGCRAELKEAAHSPLARIRLPSGSYVMTHGNRQRRYHVHLPKAREHEVKLPLVLALHGAPGHGANMMEFSGVRELADRKGFIAVFPDGTSAQDPVFLNWNSGTCCGYARDNNIDDVGFLRRLIELLLAEYEADSGRVYVTGFSKGGMMAYYFACQHTNLLAGIAVVAGAFNLSECHPARALDVLIVHGRADAAIPYGGELPRKIPPLRETEDRPVSYATHFWRKVNHCHRAASSSAGTVEVTDYHCFRAPLRLISLSDEGHTWPGAADGLIGAEKPRGQFLVGEAIWSFWQGLP
ncbi:MAG TPA: PHB depolymerase family esterase [Turneriella sp.]|nr:PHB depolymerase family esterase [Turneriella sp.]HNL10262.1 PHB depolymerase family esterase [Turneriella sp.]HNL54167.1 PHB depolymerase family esterase [Turneriella sp.]